VCFKQVVCSIHINFHDVHVWLDYFSRDYFSYYLTPEQAQVMEILIHSELCKLYINDCQ